MIKVAVIRGAASALKNMEFPLNCKLKNLRKMVIKRMVEIESKYNIALSANDFDYILDLYKDAIRNDYRYIALVPILD